jgi:hypothetical protein
MSATYYAKDSGVLDVQLKVQELILKLEDNQVISASGSTVTVTVNETITEIRSATFIKDSTATAYVINAANTVNNGTSATFTLSTAMLAADTFKVSYVTAE